MPPIVIIPVLISAAAFVLVLFGNSDKKLGYGLIATVLPSLVLFLVFSVSHLSNDPSASWGLLAAIMTFLISAGINLTILAAYFLVQRFRKN